MRFLHGELPEGRGRVRKAYLLLVYVFLYVPIAVLMILSFNKAGLPTAWTGFSTEWYGRLAANPKIIWAAQNSLIVAVCSSLVATALGTMLALGVERGRTGAGVDALLFAPMIIPDIVLARSLVVAFKRNI
jgi:spermidine/putrescine transport system permease protein